MQEKEWILWIMDGWQHSAHSMLLWPSEWEENETLKEDRLSQLKTRKQSKRTRWCCWWIGPVWVCWDWKCSKAGLFYDSRSSFCVSAGCGGMRFRFVQTSRDSEHCTCQRVSLGNIHSQRIPLFSRLKKHKWRKCRSAWPSGVAFCSTNSSNILTLQKP